VATRVGALPEWLLTGLGLAAAVAGLRRLRRLRTAGES
jgi:hypothetical protein